MNRKAYSPHLISVKWETAVALWAKLKSAWELVVVALAIVFAIGCFLCIPWLIYDVSVHPAERARVGHSLLRSVEWGVGGLVLTKLWGWVVPKEKRHGRKKVQGGKS